ncbi:glycosyl hydrolase family 61-domain-containing protein [Earliella scabrosa]|nr:glycosyl hydrolase family 61-domain-containing protein [Earliella scabrosa]
MWINGVDQGSSCVRLPQSNSPVTSVTSPDIACNASPKSSQGICQVMPGDEVTVEMHQQPNDRSCANEALGGAHYGPLIAYMAKVDDARTTVGSSAKWFKVAEMGLPSSSPDYWGTQVLNDNCGHFTFKVPANLAPGNYLVRAEAIALHTAGGVGGAQFYMSCFQVNVGGSGSAAGSPTVSFPGAYSAQDPGILINIYQQLNSYVIPGPSPFATTSPTVATTPYPTTATWNTAQQPTAVPTVVPAPGTPGIPKA